MTFWTYLRDKWLLPVASAFWIARLLGRLVLGPRA
jgi:hypothetical protein